MRISCLCRSRFAPVSALTRSAWSGAGTTPHNGIVWMGRRSETHPGRGCGRGLLRPRSFEQSPGQITLPAHRPAQHEVATGQFVKENVLVERPGNEKEAPFAQTRVSETAAWPQIGMLAQQPARGLHRVEVAIGYVPARLGHVPIELALNIGNEI